MIRRAKIADIERISELLAQVCLVHHEGRPDLFNIGRKYTADELLAIISDDSRPILVYTDENDSALGYAFCIFVQHKGDNILTDIKTLYIDDLCVDKTRRGLGIGKALYKSALSLAKDSGCYNLTLNVWSCNADAMRFYEKMGLVPQKIGMEKIL